MPDILELAITQEEIANGKLSDSHLADSISALRTDGIVVLADIIKPATIKILLDKSLEDLQALLNRPDAPFNWTRGHVQQAPPPFPPYLFREILVNDLVISVTKEILGAGLKSVFYSGNTATPSENRQPVHADEGQLWPNLEMVPPAHSLVVNIPLVDMGPENGSTEVWPTTHVDPAVSIQSGDIEIPYEKLEAQRAKRPPIQPVVRAGSVVIRDIRMWHAGMPNRTQHPRPMIAMIHVVSWWPSSPVKFAKSAESFLAHPDLRWQVEYTDSVIDHISTVTGHKAETAV